MLITIITVCFNSENTIRDTFRSIQNQKNKSYEHIVIDGASTDKTLQIIQDVKDEKTIVLSEKDDGIYHAMNKGLDIASGDIVGFLNADDIFASDDALKDIEREFKKNTNLNIVYGDLQYVSENDTSKIKRKWVSGNPPKNAFFNSWVPPHPTFYVKKETIKQVGNFDTEKYLAADFDFMFRCFSLNGVETSYIPKFMINMRLGGATNKSFVNIFKQNIQILNSLGIMKNPAKITMFVFYKIVNRIIQRMRVMK